MRSQGHLDLLFIFVSFLFYFHLNFFPSYKIHIYMKMVKNRSPTFCIHVQVEVHPVSIGNRCLVGRKFGSCVQRRRYLQTGKRCMTATTAPPSTDAQISSVWSPETHQLQLYNTLTRQKQAFTTIEPGVVRFYSCGPTVYDYAHIGNFRAFLTYDVVKRWLLYRGYVVQHVTNLTDVDDKIIKKVKQLGCTAQQLTDKYASAFFNDLELLNVIPAQHYPRATQHIDEITSVISTLQSKGHAYERDGSYYFNVASFPKYGRLADLERRQEGSSISATDSDEYEKNDLRDFALWKTFKPEDNDVYWNTNLGKGRPGWHIECSCMAMKYLGPQLDIHGGGIDLVFPHHENEIAQSEAMTGRPFSTFWLHNGFVNIDNEKMSKSLGNFRTLRDIVVKPDDARAFRYLVVSSQYRSALAFAEQSMKSARSTVKRLDTLRKRLQLVDKDGSDDQVEGAITKSMKDFCDAMDDDLNTPRASAAMFSLANVSEKLLKGGIMTTASAKGVLKCLDQMDRVFGIFYTPNLDGVTDQASDGDEDEVQIPEHLTKLLAERAEARAAKNYTRADEIRDELSKEGYVIVDTKDGAKLRRLNN